MLFPRVLDTYAVKQLSEFLICDALAFVGPANICRTNDRGARCRSTIISREKEQDCVVSIELATQEFEGINDSGLSSSSVANYLDVVFIPLSEFVP